MGKAAGLNRQVIVIMGLVLVGSFIVTMGGSYAIYEIVWRLWPWAIDMDGLGTLDYLVLAVLLAIGLLIACLAGWRLAQRLSRPLEAVAVAARAVSSGDLGARAVWHGKGFGETDTLIADFNLMADQLERSEAELQYSNSAIAHELRTPLTVLRGRLQGLADGVFEPSPELYRGLTGQVEDLSRLVDDLRTLGLFSAGHLDLHLVRTDLAAEAARVVDMIAPDLIDAGFQIECKLAPVMVRIDAARVRQALLAVLDNARRYGGRGIVVIETSAMNAQAVLSCTDFGSGLPRGQEHRVFERFWRGDDSRSRAGGGSGLGLAVVRAIARAHGGEARAWSRPGQGTRIEIVLPEAEDDEAKVGCGQ